MDLDSTNGTFLNGEKIEGSRYYGTGGDVRLCVELREGDELRFGFSTRTYILLNENSVDASEAKPESEVKSDHEDVLWCVCCGSLSFRLVMQMRLVIIQVRLVIIQVRLVIIQVRLIIIQIRLILIQIRLTLIQTTHSHSSPSTNHSHNKQANHDEHSSCNKGRS